ncbi:MAG: DbpA RNA binding domain-containing protein, partial [Opitutaceae bacterium]
EDYTHRIGRTGRAGRSGHAFTFVSGREIYKLESMARFAKLQIHREHIPSIDQIEEARENIFFEKLRATLDAREFKAEDRMIDRLLEQGYSSTDIAAALLHLLQNPSTSSAAGKEASTPKAPAASVGPKAPASRSTPDGAPVSVSKAVLPQAPEPAPVVASEPVVTAEIAVPASATAPTPAQTSTPAPSLAPERIVAARPKHAIGGSSRPTAKPTPQGEVAAIVEVRQPRPVKAKFNRDQRTGRDPRMTTLFFNVGQKSGVTPADLVGKIAGVTRLPAEVVGAIDIHTRHSLVDVSTELAQLILKKLNGVRVKGQALKPLLATAAEVPEE